MHDTGQLDVVQVNRLSVFSALPSLFFANGSNSFGFDEVNRASGSNSTVTLDGLRWTHENVLLDGIELHVEQVVERELGVSIDKPVELDHNLFDRLTCQLTVVRHAIIPEVKKSIGVLISLLSFSLPSNLVD